MAPPIRIAVITNAFPPEFGAAPYRISDMAKGLAAAGFEVEVFTGTPAYPHPKAFSHHRTRFFQAEIWEGLSVRRHWHWLYGGNSLMLRGVSMLSLPITIWLFSGIRLLHGRYDYLYVQYPPIALAATLAFPLAKIKGSRMLLNLSDLWPDAMKALGVVGQGPLYRMLDRLTRLLYRNSFACLAQSEEIVGHALQHGGRQALLYRTGVDTALFLPKKDYLRAAPRLRLVYAGTLGLAHGLTSLCRHIDFGSLGAELHIYGDGVERDALVAHIASRDDVYWHGGLPNADIPALLPQFDAALVCQKAYLPGTLPSKIYEALACGLPVLFHGEGEGRQIVAEAGGLHSLPTDFEAFKANLSQFVHASPEYFAAVGRKGRAMAEAQFSRQKQVEMLVGWLSGQSR